MTIPEAIIYDRDRLRSAGLKHILHTNFGLQVNMCDTMPGRTTESNNPSEQALIFVTPEIFTAACDFFTPRRKRTVVISSAANDSLPAIDPTIDIESIIETLDRIITELKENVASDNRGELSQREIEVLRLVARGHINKEIADILNISIHTVLSHRKNITAKLGIKSTSGLAVYAMMNGYISDCGI